MGTSTPPPRPVASRPERSGRGAALLVVLLLPTLVGGAPPHDATGRKHLARSLQSPEKPGSRDPRLTSAYSALQAKDLTGAYRLSVLAEKHGVPRGAVLPLQADIFRAADYLDKEMSALQQWTSAAPRDPLPWIKLFHIYLDLGWKHEAEAASRKAFALAPRNPRCYVTRALLAYRSNEPAAGLPAIKAAERLDPANTEYANLHASLLLKALRFPDAEQKSRQILKKAPQSKEDRLALVQALLGQNKTSEAEAILRSLQSQEPENAEVACQLGLLAEKKHDPIEATRQFEKAAASDAQYSNVLWHLGRLYIQQRRTEEGQKLLKLYARMDANASDYETLLKRLETRPDDISLHYRLARAHQAADELPQATVEFRRVLQLRPAHPAARKDLAAALTRAGRTTEARAVTLAHNRP
jgi:Flp pilus assembly protein TadD